MGFNMFDLLDPTDNENFKTVDISIDNLVPSKDNFYKIDNLGDLKKSIELVGIQQNLVVKEIENGKYQIITGHRRYAASKELVEDGKEQFKTLPCLIYQNNNKDDELIFLFTNSTTRELTDWEKTKQAEKLKEVLANYKGKFQGRKRDIIAQMLNTSPTQVARMDSINNNLIPGLQEEFKEENLNISAAYEASTLPKEKQKEILEQYNVKGSISIKEVKEKKIDIKKDIPPEKIKVENKNILEIDGDTGEILNVPRFKTNFEIIKDLTIDEMTDFICSRCNGGNGCAGFCDLAIECTYDNRHEICIKWLSLQAQKN